jgi:hypothetical protein
VNAPIPEELDDLDPARRLEGLRMGEDLVVARALLGAGGSRQGGERGQEKGGHRGAAQTIHGFLPGQERT